MERHQGIRTGRSPAGDVPMSARILSAFAALPLLAACATQGVTPQRMVPASEMQAFLSDKPTELHSLYSQVLVQGPRNATLNWMRSGLAALDRGHLDVAARSFDEATRSIDAFFANNPAAERARSVWYAEAEKDFRGEAHERAMAHYYRGVVHLMKGEYAEGRVSFRAAREQTGFSANNQRVAPEFVTASLLEGFAARCAAFPANIVDESFETARRSNPNLRAPAVNETMVVFETGQVPFKIPVGQRRELLAYSSPYTPTLSSVRARIGDDDTQLTQADNLYGMVISQGGRIGADSVNDGKARTQALTQGAGNAATMIGAASLAASTQMRGRAGQNAAIAGGAALLVGLIAEAAAQSMHVEADWRTWDNLPGNLLVGYLPAVESPPVASGGRRGQPRVFATSSAPMRVSVTFSRAIQEVRHLNVRSNNGCSFAWGREVPAIAISTVAPGIR